MVIRRHTWNGTRWHLFGGAFYGSLSRFARYGDSDKPVSSDTDLSTYCKRTTANDQVAVMQSLGFDKYHLVGHDRGVRVGLRMALDYPEKILTFTNLDVVPAQEAFENMDSSLAYAWFHWHLMRQPAPFPETVMLNNAKLFLDLFLETWSADRVLLVMRHTPNIFAVFLTLTPLEQCVRTIVA